MTTETKHIEELERQQRQAWSRHLAYFNTPTGSSDPRMDECMRLSQEANHEYQRLGREIRALKAGA